MRTHTPGPWFVVNEMEVWTETSSGSAVRQNGARAIALCSHRDRRFSAESERNANARLIAAAPEMLVALKMAIHYLGHPDVLAIPFAMSAQVPAARIRAVLAKIEGGG